MTWRLYPTYQGPPPFSGGETISADKWIYPWSDPVRFRHIRASLIVSGGTWHPQNNPPVNPWFMALAEPVRHPRRLHASLNPFQGPLVVQPPGSATLIQGWFTWMSEPVRQPKGLKAPYHTAVFLPSRILPTPDVTVTMYAIETNNDVALFGVDVTGGGGVTGQSRAIVTITEIPAQNQAGASIGDV